MRGEKRVARLRAERGSRVKTVKTRFAQKSGTRRRGKLFDLLFDLLCDPKVARAILKGIQRKAVREYADAQDILDRIPK